MRIGWNTLKGGVWQWEISARNFIQKNYTPYDGNNQFLGGPTENTTGFWDQATELSKKEPGMGGILDMDTKVISTVTSHGPGYLNKDKETTAGFQINKPFKCSLQPYGGIRIAMKTYQDNGSEVDPEVVDFFTEHRKTHSAGVLSAYTDEMRTCHFSHIVIRLPDVYECDRIIGNYHRITLYGVDALIQEKKEEKDSIRTTMYSDVIRECEGFSEWIRALEDSKTPGTIYGFDISKPAADVKEVIQWTYFGYLAAVREQSGAAMSLGHISTFLDIYVERDLREGRYMGAQAQEFVDHFIMELRLARFARTPEYNDLFSGDPTRIAESIGGIGIDGRRMTTKMSYRYLHTPHNLGTASESNLTILWPTRLLENFKRSCAKTSIGSSSIQYENGDLMKAIHGDDYTIVCCVSSMRMSKEMQSFGVRANPVKCLLYITNGGVDEITGKQASLKYCPVTSEYLAFDEIMDKYEDMIKWLAKIYVNALSIIHYNHDRYSHERLQTTPHNRKVVRWSVTDIAGPSVVADSLSATEHAEVKAARNEKGIVTGYIVKGGFFKCGNNDDHVNQLATDLVHIFMGYIKGDHTCRGGTLTTSIPTTTSNVVYGKNTGSTLGGRKDGQPSTPGVNPMYHGGSHGAVVSLIPMARLPSRDVQDGISNIFPVIPGTLGKDDQILTGDPGVELSSCPSCDMGGNLFEGLDSESDVEEPWSTNYFIRKRG